MSVLVECIELLVYTSSRYVMLVLNVLLSNTVINMFSMYKI